MSSKSNVVRLPSVNETTLSQRIAKYAEVWLTTSNKTAAYEAAGYGCPTPSNAYNFHKQHHEAIMREAHMGVANHVPVAMSTLAEIMVSGKSETARVKAALEILDRAGLDKTTKIQIGSDMPQNKDELQAQLKALLEANPDVNIFNED